MALISCVNRDEATSIWGDSNYCAQYEFAHNSLAQAAVAANPSSYKTLDMVNPPLCSLVITPTW